MNSEDLQELFNIHEISDHAYYLLAVCLMKSIGGGATLLKTTPRSVLNHIKWLQCLTGKKLLQDVIPGQTMKPTSFGKSLGKELMEDFQKAIKNLNMNKMDGVLGNSFIEVIKDPYWSYKFPHNSIKISSKKPRKKPGDVPTSILPNRSGLNL